MNKKRILSVLLILPLIFHGCKKDRLRTSIQPRNRNGIIHGQLQKELSYNRFITLDINGDQRDDLYFTSVLIYDGQSHLYLFASPTSSSMGMLLLDESIPTDMNQKWAQPITKGEPVQQSDAQGWKWTNYMIKGLLLDIVENPSGKEFRGPWLAEREGYLGVKLLIGGKAHYGWVRIVHRANEEKLTIAEYAFNATPMEDIKAGQISN